MAGFSDESALRCLRCCGAATTARVPGGRVSHRRLLPALAAALDANGSRDREHAPTPGRLVRRCGRRAAPRNCGRTRARGRCLAVGPPGSLGLVVLLEDPLLLVRRDTGPSSTTPISSRLRARGAQLDGPASGENRTAFDSRLNTTCFTLRSSAR